MVNDDPEGKKGGSPWWINGENVGCCDDIHSVGIYQAHHVAMERSMALEAIASGGNLDSVICFYKALTYISNVLIVQVPR